MAAPMRFPISPPIAAPAIPAATRSPVPPPNCDPIMPPASAPTSVPVFSFGPVPVSGFPLHPAIELAASAMLALLWRKSGTIVVHQDANGQLIVRRPGPIRNDLDGDTGLRPFARIVHEVADHFREVLLFAAKTNSNGRIDVDCNPSMM